MDADIQKLINSTTIVRAEDRRRRKVVYENYGSKTSPNTSRYQRNYFINGDQGNQIDLAILESHWDEKWKSFGKKWTKERQNLRFLYDSFRFFYYSFEQLRFNKVECINEFFGDRFNMIRFNELTGVSLYGMYHHGKKCIDLLEKLNLININNKHEDWNFLKKFKETRNKLLEHNYNPYGLKLQIDPSIWSLAGTDSLLEIHIHKPKIERVFDVYVNYYEDYYKLEKIITEIIKIFNNALRNFDETK